jgi:hypothetical protein
MFPPFVFGKGALDWFGPQCSPRFVATCGDWLDRGGKRKGMEGSTGGMDVD